MRSLNVYLAGASRQIIECEHWMGVLRAEGLTIALDWCAAIRSAGRPDWELSTPEREAYAAADLKAVRECDVLWLLVPGAESTSRGCWLETGYCIGQCKPFICSGDDKRSLFTSLARRSFVTHEGAATYLIEAQRRQLAYERLDWTVGL